MNWDARAIRRNTFRTVFCKGIKAWLMLVFVAFLFSYFGAANASQAAFVGMIEDRISESESEGPSDTAEIFREYLSNTELAEKLPFITSKTAITILDGCTRTSSWLVRFFASNGAYFQRNLGEVIAFLLLTTLLVIVARLLIQGFLIIGRYRYVMENRFDRDVPLRRLTSPFHREHLKNVFVVMLRYHLTLLLWSLTAIGGLYKLYQYGMVPYLLAENPSLTWQEARDVSCQMTLGYKRKMFLMHLSFFYLWILMLIPIVGLFLGLPVLLQLNAEMFFTLRSRVPEDSPILAEPAFAGVAYVNRTHETTTSELPSHEPYRLSNISIHRSRNEDETGYKPVEYLFMFFFFSMLGWIWECSLSIIRDHVLVNRGTKYGPWIPIYGYGGILVIFLLHKFRKSKLRVFLYSIIVCAAAEYLTSFILEYFFNVIYWDYTTEPFNLNGRIYLEGMLVFGLSGLAGVHVLAPSVSAFSERLKPTTRRRLAVTLLALYGLDIIACTIFGFNPAAGLDFAK